MSNLLRIISKVSAPSLCDNDHHWGQAWYVEVEGIWRMSGWFSTIWSFLLLCTSSLIIMPVKYMREIMENFQVKQELYIITWHDMTYIIWHYDKQHNIVSRKVSINKQTVTLLQEYYGRNDISYHFLFWTRKYANL